MKKFATMKRLTLLLLMVLTLWAVGAAAQNDISDEELLQAMDFARFGAFFQSVETSSGGSLTMEIAAQRPDGAKQAVVQVVFKMFEDGNFYFRINYLSPEELEGDVFLVTPEEVFFWNPDLISPIKVNGQFEVFGDATVAEVVGIFFTGDYTILEREAVTLEGGRPGLWLKLQATRETVAFQLAEVTADAETLQPVNLKLFDASGDLLHDNSFESYTMFDQAPLFESQLLDNRIVPVNRTLLHLTSFTATALADEAFNPALLAE